MSDLAMRVENLGKRYRIGSAQNGYKTLRETFTDALTAPFRRVKQISRGVARQSKADYIWALQGVGFEIKPGEVVGIIGRNGAGKSTLLKVLSRITEPTNGCVDIYGRVGSLLEVGTGFHPELTGRENVYLNGAILGMRRTEIERKFEEIVAFAEIGKFLDTAVKHYSSGMYLRLAFAVAAHLEPEILIVDEVLAVGDAGFQRKCLGKMGDVAREGRTVLFVSHNMTAVAQFCQKAIWLEGGRIRRIGSAEDVIRDYLSDGNRNIAERQWSQPDQAPGDDRVRLMAARVLQYDRTTSVIDINAPSRVEIEFEVLSEARNLITGINLYDAMGVCLFGSCDWRPNRLPPGRYCKHAELPAQLLAEGRVEILVQLVFYDPDIKSVVLPNTLAIEATDSDHPLSVRGHYKGAWPGAVRVLLPWSDTRRTS
jgi:lipopolysaccharide transport system ATP-binding protein